MGEILLFISIVFARDAAIDEVAFVACVACPNKEPVNEVADIASRLGLIVGPGETLSNCNCWVPAVLEDANTMGKLLLLVVLEPRLTFEAVCAFLEKAANWVDKLYEADWANKLYEDDWANALYEEVATIPSKVPVIAPAATIILPVTINAWFCPEEVPFTISEPVTIAGTKKPPVYGKASPPPPRAFMVTFPIPVLGDILILEPCII